MPGTELEYHAGLYANDRCGRGEDDRIDAEGQHHADERNHARFQYHGSENDPALGTQGTQDRDVTFAFVHGIVNARQDRSGRHHRHQVSNHFQHPVEPTDLSEQLRHDLIDRPGKGQLIPLFVVHHVQTKPGLGIA